MPAIQSCQPVKLACPTCGGKIRYGGTSSSCVNCDATWPLKDGAPVFVSDDFYWGEVPQETMRDILERAARDGWREAAAAVLGATDEALCDYISDVRRADWRFLIPLTQQSVVLDAGAGWGTLTFPLAGAAGHVVALEAVRERAEFIRLRQRQDGIHNVQVVQADACAPPFPPESFDLVVMTGMLEWLAVMDTSGDPREVQLSALSKTHRVLKPGGRLYIGVENRYGYSLFLGARDHSGLRFTSLMPRHLADWWVRVRRPDGFSTQWRTGASGSAYRTYTYSHGGYRRLLQEAGFSHVDVYVPMPSYVHPHCIFPIGARSAQRFCLGRLFWARSLKRKCLEWGWRVALAFGLAGPLAYSFSLVARKDS